MKSTVKFIASVMSVLLICSAFFACNAGDISDTTENTTAEIPADTSNQTTAADDIVPDEEDVDPYERSVRDSVFAEEDEILPLVTLTKDSNMVTWNEAGDKVLMVSWHRYPESYPDGSTFVCSYGEVWAFTDKEILSWYQENSDGVTDWDLRFEQLIGLPRSKEYTHFTAFWVDIDELIRPAYQTDVTKQITAKDLSEPSLGEHKEWFDGNIVWSYFDSDYPWTRLGYTYDWFEDDIEYGLSEFIILEGSEVEVEWTVTTEEFLAMLESGNMKK